MSLVWNITIENNWHCKSRPSSYLFLIFPIPWYTRHLLVVVYTAHKHTQTFLRKSWECHPKGMWWQQDFSQHNLKSCLRAEELHRDAQPFWSTHCPLWSYLWFVFDVSILVPVLSKYTSVWTNFVSNVVKGYSTS